MKSNKTVKSLSIKTVELNNKINKNEKKAILNPKSTKNMENLQSNKSVNNNLSPKSIIPKENENNHINNNIKEKENDNDKENNLILENKDSIDSEAITQRNNNYNQEENNNTKSVFKSTTKTFKKSGLEIHRLESSLKNLENNNQENIFNHSSLKNQRINELYEKLNNLKNEYYEQEERREYNTNTNTKSKNYNYDIDEKNNIDCYAHEKKVIRESSNKMNHYSIDQININSLSNFHNNNYNKLSHRNIERGTSIKEKESINSQSNSKFQDKSASDNESMLIKLEQERLTENKKVQLSILEECFILYKKLLFLDSENVQVLVQLSQLYLQMYDISSAITYLKKAKDLDPYNDDITNKLESLQFAKGIIMLKNDQVSVENLLSSKMRNKEENKRGCIAEIPKDDYITTNVDINSNSVFYIYFRALAFIKINKKELALKELDKIILKDPKNIEALLLVAKIYLSLGKESESNFYFWKVNSESPHNPEIKSFVWLMKSKMQNCMKEAQRNLHRENYKCALLWLSKGLKYFPNHPECLIMRSSVYKHIKNLGLAIKDLDLAQKYIKSEIYKSKINEIISSTYNELAVNTINKNLLNEAIKLLNEAIKYSPNNKYLYINKGDCFFKSKDYNSANSEYLKAFKLDGESQEIKARIATVLFKYAILCFNSKEYNNCINYLKKSLEYTPLCSEFYLLTARCFLKLNDKFSAIINLEKGLEVNPEHRDCILMMKNIN